MGTVRSTGVRAASLLAALSLVVAGCGSGDDGGGGGEGGDTADQSLTVWTIEDVADRVAAQKRMAQQFTTSSGIKVDVVSVAEDDFDKLITSAAAADKLPDVVAALPLSPLRTLQSGELLDTETPKKIIEALGADTFAPRSLELTKDGDAQLGVPSDGWAQLLVYRKDLFQAAGLEPPTTYEAIEKAAQTLNGKSGVAGIALATAPGDGFTEQSFEYLAGANGCQLVGDDGNVTLSSPQCVRAFDLYGKLAKSYSVKGNQDVDSTRATYFAGKAAMVIWSSFLLDELAGLRKDALPSCAQCKADPAWLAKNSGVVTSVKGPDGSEPSSFGEVVSWAVTSSAPKDAAAKFVQYMLSDAYTDWLAIAPEGKVPTRQGTKSGDTSYLDSWQKLKAGVDTKAPLSEYYGTDVLKAVQESPEQFSRWGLTQGQGALVGAIQGPRPIAGAVSDVATGKSTGQAAAETAQKAVEDIKKDIN
jgi:multiple sugar transport system substrate-binding protein